ncbi:NAD-dependent epimerase/dehydratase family protein [Patescibacteria group bacterium]|nr:NAD-dependent epimerase/dehydratase family protein [Patescibacteria group bacterium]MBU1705262.1 NAD-dependent epimerase/dehydratase family protein [Patescibacteria group bacterium]
MTKIKKAIVTGGAGFIGSHIVDALIKRRIKVAVVDDLSTGQKKNLNPNAKFFQVSIASPQFPQIIKKLKPDVIFHCAAQINVRESVNDPLKDARQNILGTLALAQAAADANVKKIIFSSSGGAMFSDAIKPPYSEKQEAQPVSPYGIAKRAGEMYLDFFHQTHGLPYVALRYANVYGPRQNDKGEAGVIAIFAGRMLKGQPVKINGTGRQTRDFVYVDDVVKANMLAMRKNATGIFHVGTGRQTEIKTIFKKINALTGGLMPQRHNAAQPGEVMRSALDCRKAKQSLAWQPSVKMDEGLKKTVEWFRKQK